MGPDKTLPTNEIRNLRNVDRKSIPGNTLCDRGLLWDPGLRKNYSSTIDAERESLMR